MRWRGRPSLRNRVEGNDVERIAFPGAGLMNRELGGREKGGESRITKFPSFVVYSLTWTRRREFQCGI